MATYPSRLHVLLAREKRVGLVIRRGPSKQVCTYLWDRESDVFTVGQWFKGRIYERRSDLSPDGKYFLYFAMNGHWKSEAKGSWTAISKTPYLKALVLVARGDTWMGGGLFTGHKTYWLNDNGTHGLIHDSNEVERDLTNGPSGWLGGICLPSDSA